jgi:hypothetical protein
MSDTALFLALPPALANLPCWDEFTKQGITIHVSSRLPRISKQERAFMRTKVRRRKYQVQPRKRNRR